MLNNMRFLGVIPARGGSKGIPDKNIVKVNGRHLIDYTVSEAKKSKYLDRSIVSTDSEKIAQVARDCGADVPFLRDESLALDETKMIDVLIDLLHRLALQDIFYDYLVLLQPTQPLRMSWHIDEAIELIVSQNYKSLVSVNISTDHPLLLRTIDNQGKLENLLMENSTVRRQEFLSYYKVNGAIYINRIDSDFNCNTSLNDNLYPYIMDKRFDLDIDEPFDLEMFQFRYKKLVSCVL